MRRSQRIAAITKMLVERPHQVFSLTEFAQGFDAAKSTLSEDITLIRETFRQLDLGRIETIPGAAGGVRYVPSVSPENVYARVNVLCDKLSEPQRLLPGGFIYLNDLAESPAGLVDIGEIFATKFQGLNPSYVVTVETAGIPIALMTARALNIPLVVARRVSRATEGPVLTMNYVSGSTRRVETMSLSRRALPENSRVLIIDDFMKAGGTMRGLIDLMGEFRCDVVGKGVLIETREPEEKLVSDYLSLIKLEEVDQIGQRVKARPAEWILAERSEGQQKSLLE